MARKIIKKLGGDRIGSGNQMTVEAHGYGYSTHDLSKVRRTSMSFGTIVPMNSILMTSGSTLRINLDALITSNALKYQLYGSAKFQLDVFSARLALYNPKMLLNLNDQGYDIADIKFPQMELKTRDYEMPEEGVARKHQVGRSSLLRYLGIDGNGQAEGNPTGEVVRKHNAMDMLVYYHIIKEYYANKQEKIGMMIHNVSPNTVMEIGKMEIHDGPNYMGEIPEIKESGVYFQPNHMVEPEIWVYYKNTSDNPAARISADLIQIRGNDGMGFDDSMTLTEAGTVISDEGVGGSEIYRVLKTSITLPFPNQGMMEEIEYYRYFGEENEENPKGAPRLQEWDLKAVDRMSMRIMAGVESANALILDEETELPYGACLKGYGGYRSIEGTQEGLCIGTYQSDVFNNWLDNETINNLNNKSKVKVNEEGEFSIDVLNITQKLYNYDMRIGITDGTLDEWRELTYGQSTKGKSLKPVYEGGLSKEIVFDMVVSTASTEEEPLGSIASRGQFGSKHKGGSVSISADEEKIVMILAKITPRIVYSQGNSWTTNLKTLEDLHKPAFDKIGYQDLITDTMASFDTQVKSDGTLVLKSVGKQPAWQWYRTSYDDAMGNMADIEDYKVFGRSYEAMKDGDKYRIKDLTTYIDPMKYNDVFVLDSLDAMNFDVQVGMDIKATLIMSEEVIPNL